MSKQSDNAREDELVHMKRVVNLKQNTNIKLEDFKDDCAYWHEFFVARADLSEPMKQEVISLLGKLSTAIGKEQQAIDETLTQLKINIAGE